MPIKILKEELAFKFKFYGWQCKCNLMTTNSSRKRNTATSTRLLLYPIHGICIQASKLK